MAHLRAVASRSIAPVLDHSPERKEHEEANEQYHGEKVPGDQGRNRQKHRRLHQAGNDHRDILKALPDRGGLGAGREHESPKRLPDEEAPARLQQMANEPQLELAADLSD